MRVAGFILLLALISAAAAQEPLTPPAPVEPKSPAVTVLENNGRPMLVPFQCTADDIQLAGMTCSEDEPCPVYLEISSVGAVANRIVLAGAEMPNRLPNARPGPPF
jgi:hypothetical protein